MNRGDNQTNFDYPFIIDSQLRNQNDKLDIVIIFSIGIFVLLLFAWAISVYIKVDEINIYDCNNEIEVDGIDINYLIEQNHYKQLSTNEAKQRYKQLNKREKILDIKKQLITNIMKA
jgi:cell division protein FtsL